MGPDFLDSQCLWYIFCCNLICVLFLIQNSFSSRISGYPANRLSGRILDIKKGRISGASLAMATVLHLPFIQGSRIQLPIENVEKKGIYSSE